MAGYPPCGPRARADRRSFLQVGALGGLGLSLGSFFRLRAARGDAKSFHHFEGTAQSVIHVWLPGGWAQQETFDPKPLAPVEYRGDMAAIDTALPGVRFNEQLARTAKIADKITVVRSMTGIFSAPSRFRSCRAESSSSVTIRLASAARASRRISSSLPAPT